MKIGLKVGKKTSQGYYIGIIKETKKEKSLVYFEKRGFSRWINNINLNEITQINLN